MGKWLALPGLLLTYGVLLAPHGSDALTFAGIMAASFTLGCLLIALLQHMVRAKWGILLIDRFEAGSGPWSIVVVGVALLPAWLHPDEVYAWTRGIPGKEWWLAVGFFRFRTIVYLLFWAVLGALLRRATARGAYATDMAAAGFFLVCLTGTFASFDWAMSLEQNFASTVYGMVFLAISAVGAMGACVALTCARERSARFDQPLRRDYGNLMITMLMVWAYVGFVQYLIVWSGNIKDETDYFLIRAVGGWLLLGDALVAFGFFAPWLLLVTPRVRDSRRGLGATASCLFGVWMAFLIWLVGPDLHAPGWLDVLAIAGVGMMWIGAFFHQLRAPAKALEAVHA